MRFELALAPRLAERGIELQFELPQQPGRRVRVGDQHLLHVGLAERQAKLQQIARVAAQQGSLPPVESGMKDQLIEPVAFRVPGENVQEAGLETPGNGLDVNTGAGVEMQVKILNPKR